MKTAMFGQFLPSFDLGIAQQLNKMKDDVIVAFFKRAMAIPAVQQVIADELADHSTPICNVLKDAVASALDDYRPDVDAEDVKHLSQFIENEIDDYMKDVKFEPDQIEDFGAAVKQVIAQALDR